MRPPLSRRKRADLSCAGAAIVFGAIIAFAPLPGAARAGDAEGSFDWGYTLRLRQEYLRNVFDFSNDALDDRNYLRIRSQLWASWTPDAVWKAFLMLNNEHRHWYKSATALENQPFEIDEIIVENLYLQATKIGGTPFGFTIGRQNLFLGEGFLVWDGGPLDGSRTAYFNALVLTLAFEKRRFDAHVISDPEKDRYFPVWNYQSRVLVERDEFGTGLYYTDESCAARKLEAYYLYKREGKFSENSSKNVHTLGARWSGSAFGKLSFASEAALQYNTGYADALNDHFGSGGYVRGSYPILSGCRPVKLSAGAIYFSGDRPGSRAWDPLYSRWPKWSELYIYTLGIEESPAYWSNIIALHGGVGVEFCKQLGLDATIYSLRSDVESSTCCYCPSCPPIPFGGGTNRGILSVVKLNWNLEKYLSGHFLWESFTPGDFYREGDAAHFLRWEMLFKF